MPKLSDQIRQCIARAAWGRAELARAAGVPETALGDFLDGRGSLTTDWLDRLATVLPFGIAPQEAPAAPPRPVGRRGRRPSPSALPTLPAPPPEFAFDAALAHRVAEACARAALGPNFADRFGVSPLEQHRSGLGRDVLVYFNSRNDAPPALRDAQSDRIRRRLPSLRVREVAFARAEAENGRERSALALLLDPGVPLSEEEVFYSRASAVLSLVQEEIAATARHVAGRDGTRLDEERLPDAGEVDGRQISLSFATLRTAG